MTSFQELCMAQIKKAMEYKGRNVMFARVLGDASCMASVITLNHVIVIYIYDDGEAGFDVDGTRWEMFEKYDYDSENDLIEAFCKKILEELAVERPGVSGNKLNAFQQSCIDQIKKVVSQTGKEVEFAVIQDSKQIFHMATITLPTHLLVLYVYPEGKTGLQVDGLKLEFFKKKQYKSEEELISAFCERIEGVILNREPGKSLLSKFWSKVMNKFRVHP